MRKILPAFVALLLGALPANAELPRLSVEGNRIVQEGGKPIDLRGVSLCSLEWHQPLEQIQAVTASPEKWQVNILRLPVQPQEWDRVGPQSYIRDYLDPAVKLCTENNVYCIIDWHEVGEWTHAGNILRLQTFWSNVAKRYAANPNILYEIFNEPTEPSGRDEKNWAAWKKQAQPWVDMVRKDAPDTILLVGSPHWTQMTNFAPTDPFTGDNLVYTAHVYPNWKPETWDGLFGEASKTVPVFMSEWGWSEERDAFWVIKGTRAEYGEKMRDYLNARPHIGWTAWSYDPNCAPAMLGKDKSMGAFVKEWLSQSATR